MPSKLGLHIKMGDGLAGIGNLAQNLDPGSISAAKFLSSPIISKFAWFGKILFWMVLLIIGGVVIYKFWLQYKISIGVWKRVGGGGIERVSDRAKIVVDEQGKRKIVLYKHRNNKKTISCPIPESIYKSKKGKMDHYELFLDDNFQLHPVDLPTLTIGDEKLRHIMKIRPQERDAWARYEDKQLHSKFQKQNAWEKYMPSVIVLASFLIAFLIFFFMSKDLASSLSTLAQQFGQVATSCTKLGG